MAQAKFTDIAILALPLRTRFRQIQTREVAIFRGKRWAEFSPFLEYGDEEASQWLRAALSCANDPLPELKRKSINVNATLPAVPMDQISSTLAGFGIFNTVKIKVADTKELSEDLARVRKVRELFPDVKIRLDANGALDVESALFIAKQLKTINLEYFEQPVATIAELAELKVELAKEGFATVVAADESVRKSSDPLAVELAGAADILVLKSAPLGGVLPALEIAAASKLSVVPSSAMQSSIGLAAELHFAASLETLEFDAGLGTMNLFAGDLVRDSLKPEDGVLEVRRPELNTASLETFRAEDHSYDFWVARLERCGRLIGLEA